MRNLADAPVALRIPNDPAYLRIVRLVVASVAADLRFNFEEIEDLRIAADELVSLAMGAAQSETPVRVGVYTDEGVLSLRVSAESAQSHRDPASLQLDPLATQIVSALVDWYAVENSDTNIEVGFRSRPPSMASSESSV